MDELIVCKKCGGRYTAENEKSCPSCPPKAKAKPKAKPQDDED